MTFARAIPLNLTTLIRTLVASGASGLVLPAGFFAINAPLSGLFCRDGFVVTTASCLVTGISTIDPRSQQPRDTQVP